MLRRWLPPSWHSDTNLLRIYDCELVTRDTSLEDARDRLGRVAIDAGWGIAHVAP
jgi:hypothetical protein